MGALASVVLPLLSARINGVAMALAARVAAPSVKKRRREYPSVEDWGADGFCIKEDSCSRAAVDGRAGKLGWVNVRLGACFRAGR